MLSRRHGTMVVCHTRGLVLVDAGATASPEPWTVSGSGGRVQRVCVVLSCVFFFSSRRRHTRCSRDWSSDVCSSDLLEVRVRGGPAAAHADFEAAAGDRNGGAAPPPAETATLPPALLGPTSSPAPPKPRSEERRVGKEGRWRLSREHAKTTGGDAYGA